MADPVILGVTVAGKGKEALEHEILDCVRAQEKRTFAYVNIHAVNIANRDVRFKDILNSAHVAYCDGEGIRLGGKILGWRLPHRVVLTYWIWDLCALFEKEGVSIFLLGGRPGVAERAASRLMERFPLLKVSGCQQGYFEKHGPENESILLAIANASPDVLFVGFGMPLQEFWIDANFPRIAAHALLPAGSMIDYVAGEKKSAPMWMANHGMEWVYRFLQEPSRLWKRYLLGNPAFLLRVVRARLEGSGAHD
jgi:N-acetylglucosaminyldiphosphoundecaprenol N-acetyl-beta-D-mannosaminyltransferase